MADLKLPDQPGNGRAGIIVITSAFYRSKIYSPLRL